MPTYEYLCTECATPLEVVASFSDPPLAQCPTCGGRLRKVFGNVGVVFKGSGFYRTDSRTKTAAKAASTSTSDTPSSSGSGDAPSSAKPAKSDSAASSTASAAPAAASAS